VKAEKSEKFEHLKQARQQKIRAEQFRDKVLSVENKVGLKEAIELWKCYTT
jgi:hypothetical protein